MFKFNFLAKDVDFYSSPRCQVAFNELKEKLYMTPILRGPNWE